MNENKNKQQRSVPYAMNMRALATAAGDSQPGDWQIETDIVNMH